MCLNFLPAGMQNECLFLNIFDAQQRLSFFFFPQVSVQVVEESVTPLLRQREEGLLQPEAEQQN